MFESCKRVADEYRWLITLSEEVITNIKRTYKDIYGAEPVLTYYIMNDFELYSFEIDNIDGHLKVGAGVCYETEYYDVYATIFMNIGVNDDNEHELKIHINHGEVDTIKSIEDNGSDIVRFYNGVVDIINTACKKYKRKYNRKYKQTCPEEE